MARRKKEKFLDQKQIIKKYQINRKIIRQYFPAPSVRTVYGRGGAHWTVAVWSEKEVEEIMSRPELQKKLSEAGEETETELRSSCGPDEQRQDLRCRRRSETQRIGNLPGPAAPAGPGDV